MMKPFRTMNHAAAVIWILCSWICSVAAFHGTIRTTRRITSTTTTTKYISTKWVATGTTTVAASTKPNPSTAAEASRRQRRRRNTEPIPQQQQQDRRIVVPFHVNQNGSAGADDDNDNDPTNRTASVVSPPPVPLASLVCTITANNNNNNSNKSNKNNVTDVHRWISKKSFLRRLGQLCQSGDVNQAQWELQQQACMQQRQQQDRTMNSTDNRISSNSNHCCIVDHEAFRIVLRQLASPASTTAVIDRIMALFRDMDTVAGSNIQISAYAPTAMEYNIVLLAWAKSFRRDAGIMCDQLMTELWSRYNATKTTTNAATKATTLTASIDEEIQGCDYAEEENDNGDHRWLPLHSSYVSTLTAWARSGGGYDAAIRAEQLLDEMERLRSRFPCFTPTNLCYNIVLNAYSSSRDRNAADRCQDLLNRMEQFYFSGGRPDLEPTTMSYNIVIDAVAQCNVFGLEHRAEALLQRMDELSSKGDSGSGIKLLKCKPDQFSFNTVMNSWARSKHVMAARRADAILRHMERRYKDGLADFYPDTMSYNTVLTAWSRSRDRDAMVRADEVWRRMEAAQQNGIPNVRPNRVSYNVMLNIYAKSTEPGAVQRAMETLQTMKALANEEGQVQCKPDFVTYNSLINVLAKRSGPEGAQQAVALLEELEQMYTASADPCQKPNIQTYTTVIHAIARSRSNPERAEQIMDRLERMYEGGDIDMQPDIVCYDALINAYGWSDQPGKALKCFEIYQKMKHLYESGMNLQAKPDIITCNSILNACAYEPANTASEHNAIVKVALQTYEDFQSIAPMFGSPNHITYGNLLMAMRQHMPPCERRNRLVELAFWHCCNGGRTGVLVINELYKILPYSRLSQLLGKALVSGPNESLRFEWKQLPESWRKHAPHPKQKSDSKPSAKRPPQRISN